MKRLYITLLALIATADSFAQKPFTLGRTEVLRSTILNENRTLNIYLPEGFSDTASYPVIYLLDGAANEDFIHTAGLVQYLAMYDLMPPSIVVGIANVNRRRDFTTPSKDTGDLRLIPVNGGSARFIAFLERELQPYIARRYKVKEKTIIGQSLGGLIATEILLKRPYLFNNYIIISPSLWWNNERMLNEAENLLNKNLNSTANVYIAVGTEGQEMEEPAKKLAAILKQRKQLTTFFVPFPEESHLTIHHRATYKGFELLYQKK